jgi:hypothetical protein
MAKDVLVLSYSTVPALIKRSYIANKEVLVQKLKLAVSHIYLAIDVWSSPNRKSLLAIVAYFVDHAYILRKALLSLP